MQAKPFSPPPSRFETKSLSMSQRLIHLTLPDTTLGYNLIRAAGLIAGALVGFVLFHFWVAAAVTAVIGIFAANTYLDWASTSQLRQFTYELPDTLLAIANALKASASLSQAITKTAERGHGLAAQELRISADQIKLGARPTQALRMLADRIPCPEMDYVMLAIGIHDEMGGNLPLTLESAASTIQQRAWLQGEVRAATAEARISAMVVCAIPLFFIFIITRFAPHYYDAMLANPWGVGILAGIGLLVLLAFWVVRKMAAAVERV
jgi:tight adherence protein B